MEEDKELAFIFEDYQVDLSELLLTLGKAQDAIEHPLALANEILNEGICAADCLTLASQGIQVTNSYLPIESFSSHRTRKNKVLAGEGIVSGIFGMIKGTLSLLGSIIGAIFKMIGKFLSWITGTSTGSTSVYTTAAAAAETIKPAPKTETVQNGPSLLTYLPPGEQAGFMRAVKAIRDKVGMTLTVVKGDKVTPDFSKAYIELRPAAIDAEQRVKHATVAIDGLGEIETALDKAKDVADYKLLPKITEGIFKKLKMEGNEGKDSATIKLNIAAGKAAMDKRRAEMLKSIASQPITNSDINVTNDNLKALAVFSDDITLLKGDIEVKDWKKAAKRSAQMASKLEHIEKKLAKIVTDGMDAKDINLVNEAVKIVTADARIISMVVTNEMTHFGIAVSNSKVSDTPALVITKCSAIIATNQADKDFKLFEVTIDQFGKPIKAKA